MDWQDVFKDKASRAASETQSIECEAARRLCSKCALPTGAARNFQELSLNAGFPYYLTAYKFKTHDLDDLHIWMRKAPTKQRLLIAFEEACEKHGGNYSEVGLVFPWHGYGGVYVLTAGDTLPFRSGPSGSYWRVAGVFYLLEHFDAFCERMGPATDW